jgi:hypothetical protein
LDALDPGSSLGPGTESAVQPAATVPHCRTLAICASSCLGGTSAGLAEISDSIIIFQPPVRSILARTTHFPTSPFHAPTLYSML